MPRRPLDRGHRPVARRSPSSSPPAAASDGSSRPDRRTVGAVASRRPRPSTPTRSSPTPPLDGQPVRVNGFFLATGDTAVLCSVVLESYPPQCGGGTVRLAGEVPADVARRARLDRRPDPRPGDLGPGRGHRHVPGERRRRPADHRAADDRAGRTLTRSAQSLRAAGHDVEPDVVDQRLADGRRRPRGRRRRARRRAGARGGRRARPSAGTSRTARRRSNRVGSSVSQHSMSTKPAASSRRVVSSARLEMRRAEPAVADRRQRRAGSIAMLPTPPHWATSQPPGAQ